jgi:hypothetical protein
LFSKTLLTIYPYPVGRSVGRSVARPPSHRSRPTIEAAMAAAARAV